MGYFLVVYPGNFAVGHELLQKAAILLFLLESEYILLPSFLEFIFLSDGQKFQENTHQNLVLRYSTLASMFVD